MEKTDFLDYARLGIALVILLGGGFMMWYGKIASETALTVIGVVVGFYFATNAAGATTKALTQAVTRALSERP
jgi:hypothetical protein